jgi:hypothetical protein
MWYSRTGSVPAPWDLWPYPHQGRVAFVMDGTNYLGNVFSQSTNVFFNNTTVEFANVVSNVVPVDSGDYGWKTLPDINAGSPYTMTNGTISPDDLTVGYTGLGLYISRANNIGTAVQTINENGLPVDYTYDVFLMASISEIYNSTLLNFYYGYFPGNFCPYMPLDANAGLWGGWFVAIVAVEQTHFQNTVGLLMFDAEGAKVKFTFPVPNMSPYYVESLPYSNGTVQLNLINE